MGRGALLTVTALAALAALGASGPGASTEPHTVLFAGDTSWRTLLRDRESAGTPQAVTRRALPDAVAPPDEAEIRDDAPVAEGPIMRAFVADGESHWSFLLAGDTLVFAVIAPDYRLLDALDVRTDPGGFPSLARAWVAAGGTPATLVVNSHFNSQEGFAAHTLLTLVDGKLEPVWDGPLLYSVTTGDDACDTRRIEQRLVRFEPAGNDIEVVFRETESCEREGTVSPSKPRDFAATLRFDAASGRYVGSFPELEEITRARMGLDGE